MTGALLPTTELEQRLLEAPEIRAGLAWGDPRRGHPEGSVDARVAALLAPITDEDPLRDDLRVLTAVDARLYVRP